MTTIDKKTARAQGYKPMTTAYVPAENWMLERALDPLRAGGVPHVLVAGKYKSKQDGVEIWTKRMPRKMYTVHASEFLPCLRGRF